MVGNIYHILLQIHHFILNLVSFPRRGISCIWQRTTHSSHHTTGRSVQLGSQWLWPARTRGDHSLELIPLLDQQLRTPSHRDLLWRVPLSGYLEYRLCEILILLCPLSFASCQISCTHSVYLNAWLCRLHADEYDLLPQVFAWGFNSCGQVGCGDNINRSYPTKLNGILGKRIVCFIVIIFRHLTNCMSQCETTNIIIITYLYFTSKVIVTMIYFK